MRLVRVWHAGDDISAGFARIIFSCGMTVVNEILEPAARCTWSCFWCFAHVNFRGTLKQHSAPQILGKHPNKTKAVLWQQIVKTLQKACWETQSQEFAERKQNQIALLQAHVHFPEHFGFI